jgi:hypothetical protein
MPKVLFPFYVLKARIRPEIRGKKKRRKPDSLAGFPIFASFSGNRSK